MKSVFIYFTLLISTFLVVDVSAQLQTPAASQRAKFETTVGLTNVSLDYSRPSKKGRTIYGDLVPLNTMWRTGANKNSIITFSDNVKIGTSEVKGGSYAIFTKPGKTSWDIYFYNDTENWGVPAKWDDDKVAAKVTVPVKTIPTVETFTLSIDNVANEGCTLSILWDNVGVNIDIDVLTDSKVVNNINKVMSGPSAADYYNAARYYRESKKDLKQALEWMNKSIAMGNDMFYIIRQKSLIEADMGNYKDAIKTATLSLEKSKEAGSNDYIKMNMDSIAEWSKK
ncbi:MAG: DUF2911 domain-containing protein [Chitinophagales bacterium]|nr:DUF2911 domain-containing protein [Chitinophagales bacterium]